MRRDKFSKSAYEASNTLPPQSDFGFPVVIKGENPATYLRLNAAVRLSDGDVHLAFTNATARFRLAIWNDGDELTLLDTEGKNTLDLSILKWRSIAAMTDYGDGAVVMLYAYGKGHVDLDFGYAMANGQSCIRDSDRLRITAVAPPLLHPDWEAYPTNTWASNWHKYFREIPGDDRKYLGWPARFPDIPAVAVNFYSTGDEVLELNVDNDVDILSGVRASLKHLSWHKQEMFKGRARIGELLGSTYWSGWGFNVDSYTALGTLVPITVNHYSPEQAADLSPAQIRSVPVFNPYPASITNTPSMSLLVRAAHLTQGIPALAPPTGGCSVRAVFSGSRSFNLNLDADEDEENEENGIPKPNGWPIRAKFPGQWLQW